MDSAVTTEQATARVATLQTSLQAGRGGILGIKAGMTQVYDPEGNSIAVTVIDLKPAIITQVKTPSKEGYAAVQVGFMPRKAGSANRPEAGHAKKASAAGFYHYQEFRLPKDSSLEDFTLGQTLTADFIKPGDFVDLSAYGKGKGFQGGMKRYHMAGGYKSHGASVCHRSIGSIGNRADPGKCFKNKKMAGQMGNKPVTVQNVQVVRVDHENRLLLVHGSVPGARSGMVTIRRTTKNASFP